MKKWSQENNKAEIWWLRKVLIDEIKWDEWFGHTDNMKQIRWKQEWNDLKAWEFIEVKIIDSGEFKLVWEYWFSIDYCYLFDYDISNK